MTEKFRKTWKKFIKNLRNKIFGICEELLDKWKNERNYGKSVIILKILKTF